MKTALIVEDERLLRESLRSHLADLWPELDTNREAADGIEAARALAEFMPDVAFLDIHIPGLHGLELARLISGRCHVVFVTAHQEYAVAAFDHGAVDFIVKPIEPERIAVTVARLRQRIDSPPPDLGEALRLIAKVDSGHIKWIQASAANKIRIIPIDEVQFFQADAKYTRVASNRGDVHIRKTVKELVDGLDPDRFWQIHRGTIVNAMRIESVTRKGDHMELKVIEREERLAVSLPFQQRFRNRWR